MTVHRVTLCGLIIIALTAPLLAQDPSRDLRQLSLAELGNVRVTTVSKVPETVWDTPASIYVLTRADIARAGVTTIPDALRLVPGVEVARIDTSRNWVVGIRGFGDQFSKGVLFLIDGRSAYTPLWAGVHWPIQDTLLEDVERIEVIRGPGGTIWGANAMNGVINVITRSAAESHGTYVSGAAGTTDLIAGARYGGRRGEVDYRFYVKGSSREPQYHTDGREFDTWAMGQAGFRLDWSRGRDAVMVTGDAYTAELGESVRVHTFNPPASFLGDDPVDLRGVNVVGRWNRRVSERSAVRVQAYVDHTYRLGTDFGERRTTLDLDAVHQWRPAARHEFVWGAGARTSPSRLRQTYTFANFTPHEHTLNYLSAFAQDTITLVPRRFAATAGVKFEHNTYTGLDVQPSVRLRWTPNTHNTVWGGVTRAVRTPSRVDEDIRVYLLIRADPPPLYAVVAGNPDLEPESALGFEAGYRTLLRPNLYLDIAAFRNQYDGLVDLGPPSIGPETVEGRPLLALVFPWINGNDGTTRGVEIAPDWQISEGWRVGGSYSYLNIDLHPVPGNTQPRTLAALEGSTPRHHVVIRSLLTLPNGIQVDPVYRYVSRRDAQDIPAYHAADLRIGIPLRRGFELAFAGHNLLDARHPEWARDPGPPVEIRRSAYVRLTWRR